MFVGHLSVKIVPIFKVLVCVTIQNYTLKNTYIYFNLNSTLACNRIYFTLQITQQHIQRQGVVPSQYIIHSQISVR